MSTKHLTYRRPDGVLGVGFFIPWAGKFTHSVSWPDLPAERYSVDRLERMGVQIVGMETVGSDEASSGSESDETQQEAEGETSSEAGEQTVAPDADVVPPDVTDSGSEPQTEATGDAPEGDQAGLVDASVGADENAATIDETPSGPDQSEADEVTQGEEAQVSEAQAIRDYLADNPDASNKEVVAALKGQGIEITSSQVTRQRKSTAKSEA